MASGDEIELSCRVADMMLKLKMFYLPEGKPLAIYDVMRRFLFNCITDIKVYLSFVIL